MLKYVFFVFGCLSAYMSNFYEYNSIVALLRTPIAQSQWYSTSSSKTTVVGLANDLDLDFSFETSRYSIAIDTRLKLEGDTQVMNSLREQVSVLVWLWYPAAAYNASVLDIEQSWAAHCNKVVYFSTEPNSLLPTVVLNDAKKIEESGSITLSALRYVYDKYSSDVKWFFTGSEQTFVVAENLRLLLSDKNSSLPIFFGHPYTHSVSEGRYHGGGYVLSREAVRRVLTLVDDPQCSNLGHKRQASLITCFAKVGVTEADARDALGRSRILPMEPATFLAGNFPAWYTKEATEYTKTVESRNVSDYLVSLNGMRPGYHHVWYFYFYHLHAHGIHTHDLKLN